ncbi:MAG: hypothetical protein SX243_12395 [Acidobacteriota bacterium]|nr:hypothetical protein [Acidobacteriota bacterium]
MVFQNYSFKTAGACLLVAMLCIAPFTLQSAAAQTAGFGMKGQTADQSSPLAYFFDLFRSLWNSDSHQDEPQVRNLTDSSTQYNPGEGDDPILDIGAGINPDGFQATGESGGATIEPNG